VFKVVFNNVVTESCLKFWLRKCKRLGGQGNKRDSSS